MTWFSIEQYQRPGVWSSIYGAMVEDAMGKGNRPAPEVVRRLQSMRGRQLGLTLASAVRSTIGRDVSDVRLHTGPLADELLALVGAPACCIGHHILIARSVVAHAAIAVPMLLHELTHIIVGRRYDVLRCWDASEHASLSAEACEALRLPLDKAAQTVGLSWPQFIQGIKNASSNMDFRGRARHPISTLQYAALPERLGGTKGEGPRHGEGLNYTTENWYNNTKLNVDEQKRHVRMAVEEFVKDKPLLKIRGQEVRFNTARTGSLGSTVGGVSYLERGWIKSLGNAFHVSQDRASHREGTQGYGHDDPRVKSMNWSPDKRGIHQHGKDEYGWEWCNEAAYNKALNNSVEVVCEFLQGVKTRKGLPIVVPIPPKKSVDCPAR